MAEGRTRRGVLRTIGGTVLGGVVTGTARVGTAQTGESWPQFGGGAANTGNVPGNTGPVEGVREAWRVGLDGPGSAVVADGTVYVESLDGLRALDAADGTERWRFGGEDEVVSPAVVDGTVYVGRGDRVYALSAGDGTERWRFSTDDSITAGPTVAGDTVLVGGSASDVYALAAADGSLRWRFPTDETVRSVPAVASDTVYVGSDDDTLYALATADGSERWRFAVGSGVGTPAVANGVVYVGGYESPLYALDAADGSERWSVETDRGYPSPSVADGTVYVERGGGVSALSAADGTERWSFGTDGIIGKPAVVDGTVYVGGTRHLYALNAADGTERWRFEAGDWLRSPAVAGGRVYVSSADGHLYALEAGSERVASAAVDLPVADARAELFLERRWPVIAMSAFGSTAALTGGALWYRHRRRDGGGDEPPAVRDDDRPTALERIRDDGDEGEPDGVSWPEEDVERLRADADEGGSTGTAGEAGEGVSDADAETNPDPASGAIDAGDSLEAEATTLDDAREAVARADALTDRAAEAGFDARREAADRRRRDPLAASEGGDRLGPPESIPRAPDVSVDYDALTDEEPIGGGGNADVTKATLPTPDGDVTLAIKVPRMSGTLHTDAVERLLTEAETWDKLDDHDHVVGVVDYGAEPLPWIAMEYMDAGHLGTRAGDLDFEQALWTALGITKGVRHAHRRGVAHLDLKPANVLFRSVEDAWDVPKVADWGLSKHLLEHSKSVEGLSPQYAAPEQFDDEFGSVDDITDVYQLGVVLYELFTGAPPFEGKPAKTMHRVLHEDPTPPSEVADVPAALDDVLLTALETDKQDRYESVLYLRDGLRDVVAD
ncbi:PQQ-binding-like beta-propeller repeat protein [Haloplanus pelagicus]|uniref:outer membrane protein assembly factor BamB family protein n=1 Tax=Haloplanus pelagicus TaxID=2949995 RepID=UPI0020406589|nr:PQQ-binding-like beta-propeller repeat protein [Haloplanus sp. HW8-1]